jgi:hypothetical protein
MGSCEEVLWVTYAGMDEECNRFRRSCTFVFWIVLPEPVNLGIFGMRMRRGFSFDELLNRKTIYPSSSVTCIYSVGFVSMEMLDRKPCIPSRHVLGPLERPSKTYRGL